MALTRSFITSPAQGLYGARIWIKTCDLDLSAETALNKLGKWGGYDKQDPDLGYSWEFDTFRFVDAVLALKLMGFNQQHGLTGE